MSMSRKETVSFLASALNIRKWWVDVLTVANGLVLLMFASAILGSQAVKDDLPDSMLFVLIPVSAVLISFGWMLRGFGPRHALITMLGKPMYLYPEGTIFVQTEFEPIKVHRAEDFPSSGKVLHYVSCLCHVHLPVIGGFRQAIVPERVLFCHLDAGVMERLAKHFVGDTACRVSHFDSVLAFEPCASPEENPVSLRA